MRSMKKILFIEDEPALQQAFGDYLGKIGYTVITVSDGFSGVEAAQKDQPDVILLDLILPKKNGFEVLGELKGDMRTKEIPVIVLTNLESPEDVDRAMEAGAVAYLVKTNYQLSELAEKIRGIIGE